MRFSTPNTAAGDRVGVIIRKRPMIRTLSGVAAVTSMKVWIASLGTKVLGLTRNAPLVVLILAQCSVAAAGTVSGSTPWMILLCTPSDQTLGTVTPA